jgi:rod shape-determining protein MreC
VSEVGLRAARVLLVTDLNSRVPVLIENEHARAVLAGDNSARPGLLYVEPQTAVKIGDRVVTSGDGGLFPPGLPVGTVAAIEDGANLVILTDRGVNATNAPIPSLLVCRRACGAAYFTHFQATSP